MNTITIQRLRAKIKRVEKEQYVIMSSECNIACALRVGFIRGLRYAIRTVQQEAKKV